MTATNIVPMTAAPANLVERLAAVMAQVERVPKSGHNAFHNYDYATEADITSAVRASLAHHGVMLIPSVEKTEWRTVKTKNGEETIATLTVKFTATDGKDRIDFIVMGEGQDRGDKATYKAMTGAIKYALLKLFLIPTGDDPEHEEEEKPQPRQRQAPRPAPAPPPRTAPAPTAEAVVQAGVDPAAVAVLTKPLTGGEPLWEEAVRMWGESRAKTEWQKARRTIWGGATPAPPVATWNEQQVLDMEFALFGRPSSSSGVPSDVPF